MLTSKMIEPIESVKETLTGGTCLGIDHFEESLDLRKKCHVCCTQTKQFKGKKIFTEQYSTGTGILFFEIIH